VRQRITLALGAPARITAAAERPAVAEVEMSLRTNFMCRTPQQSGDVTTRRVYVDADVLVRVLVLEIEQLSAYRVGT